MRTYVGYETAQDFDAGYDNFITPDVVRHWEAVFRRESEDALASLPVERDLRYGPDERNLLDFFPAAGDGPAPLLIAIHGGLWFLFDKSLMHFLARAFTARGIHFASIGYPLAPGAGLGKIVEDCRSATLWLYRQAERRHIDRARVSVLGHSAAGQLCTMVAAADWPALAPGLPAQILHRVIGASGFYDIEPFALTHFHDFTRFAPEDYRAWNPLRHVTPRLPAMSLLTGAAESSLLQQMMEHYARAVMEAGVPVETHATAGECHFSVLHQIGRPASPLFQRVLAAIQ